MGKIIPFSAKQPAKFDFERARKRRKVHPGQLDLFCAKLAEIRSLPINVNVSPFEEALLLDECDDSRAEQTYRRAIAEGDLVADAYCNLGIIESKAGRVAKAFDCFTKALEHDPRHFESHYNLGNLYFEGDNLRLARMHYEVAAEIDPEFPNLHFNMGLVLALLNDKKAAVGAFLAYQRLSSPEERGKADDLIKSLLNSSPPAGRNQSTSRQ